jgi:PKD repeat protein
MPVTVKPEADFTVNRTSGFTTDTFRFQDLSRNGANKWEWKFTPNNVGFIGGTTVNSQNPVVFLNSATSYTVRLIATNTAGSDTVEKTDVASAIGYNSPFTENPVPSGLDIGIRRVTLNDIDTTTPLVSPVYHALYNYKQTTLYRGVDYTVSVYRITNNDPQSMKVWIDYNRNTQFGDVPEETLISEVSEYKVVSSATFRVPDNSPLGNSRMRIGVSYDNSTLKQDYAGIGVFEDYGINIGYDDVKPVVTLVGNAIYKTEVNKPFVDPGAIGTDNLEGNIAVTVTGSVDNTRLGYYTLTYTATDLYGNVSDPVTRLVQVEVNQTGPVITLTGSDSVTVEVFSSFTDPGATAVDNRGVNITQLITISGTVNTKVLGSYLITYKVVDAFGFVSMKTRQVTVVDTEAPVISGPLVARQQVGSPFSNPVTVTDNYWPSASLNLHYTGSINVNVPGNYILTYYAEDGSGNEATPLSITVLVGDVLPPVIALNGSSSIEVEVHSTFIDPGVTATDNYYPNVVVSKTSTLNMHVLGHYQIVYTATDGAGNSASVTRTIDVTDHTAPVITLLGADPLNLTRFKPYVEEGYQVTDNYYPASSITVTVDDSKFINHKPGLYVITYTAQDGSGNKTVVQRKVAVSENGEVGINELDDAASFMVRPNPSKGNVFVSWGTRHVTAVKVFNILGSLVYETPVAARSGEAQLELGNLKEGVYIIRLEGSGQSLMKKINIVK